MKLIDLNILLYAINEDAVLHAPVRAWWEQALDGDESLGLPWIVLLGFLRLATSPNVFPRPLEADAAIDKIDLWLSRDNTVLVREKEEQWGILRSLLSEAGTAGNLTTDAHLAALAISYDAVLVSCDNDFARFKGLRRENPVDG